jgi:hypothetical protein
MLAVTGAGLIWLSRASLCEQIRTIDRKVRK